MSPIEKAALKEKLRKVAIVVVLISALLPPLAMNIGLNAQNAGWSGPLPKLNRPCPSLGALLLHQVWALFASISPYNYTMHYEVELTNGQVVSLRDFQKEAAGKWVSVLFHNEQKAELNLYSDHYGLRQYMEYLIWLNGLDAAWVTRRTIFLRYRTVLSREEAAAANTHYGPETTSVLQNY